MKTKDQIKVIIACLLCVVAGMFINKPTEEVVVIELAPSINMEKADSVSLVVDSLEQVIREDSVVFSELKKNHRNEINTIDSLSIHSVYLLWTGQHIDAAKKRFGTAGGLHK